MNHSAQKSLQQLRATLLCNNFQLHFLFILTHFLPPLYYTVLAVPILEYLCSFISLCAHVSGYHCIKPCMSYHSLLEGGIVVTQQTVWYTYGTDLSSQYTFGHLFQWEKAGDQTLCGTQIHFCSPEVPNRNACYSLAVVSVLHWYLLFKRTLVLRSSLIT